MRQPMTELGWRRSKAALVACALVVSAVAAVLAGDAAPAGAEEKSQSYWEQFLEDGRLPNVINSRIAMTSFDPADEAHPSAVAFSTLQATCEAVQRPTVSDPEETRFPLHVFDLEGEGTRRQPDYWNGGAGCYTPLTLDMTPDGRTVVAQATVETMGSVDGCTSANYNKPQIVTWTRSAVGQDFGAPQLVSKSTTQPTACYADYEPPVAAALGAPESLIGQGGDKGSSWPSISEDGTVVAFTSTADDLGAAPTATDAQALFVADPTGTGLAMVTPVGFDGVASQAQVSGDGKAIVFVADGTGLIDGVTEADGPQVVLARRSSVESTEWTFDLVSGVRADPEDEESYGPLDGPSSAPQISEDGSRVVFTTSASYIEDGVDTDDEDTDYWLVAREVSDLADHPLRVVVDPRDGSVGYPTTDGLGAPEMSADGLRVAVVARHDGEARFRMFDLTKALRDDVDEDPLTSEPVVGDRTDATLTGARRTLEGGSDRPLGLGGAGDRNMAALGGFDGPFLQYQGSGAALYLGGGGQIGPDISKGLHGDPVDTANGAFLQEESDLTATAAPMFMGVHRSYSSVGEQGGLFGPGWASPLDVSLDVSDEMGSWVALVLPSGRRVVYTQSGGTWSTTMGYRSALAAKSGGGWELTDPNGDVWTFDEDGLLAAWDSAGGSVDIGTRSAEGVPATVTADNGDVLTLTDNRKVNSTGATVTGADGRVDRVTAPHGIVVDYGYSRNGAGTVLHTVTAPHLPSQGANTYGRRTYDTVGSRITKISERVTTDRDRTIVENTYDAKGRVSHQVNDTGDELTFDYGRKPEPPAGLVDAPGFTTVTNAASGDVTVYQYDDAGAVVGITDALGQSVARSWENEQPGSSTSRSGVSTDYSYDAAGRVLTVSETVGASTVVTSAVTYITPDTDPAAKTDQRIATSTDAAGVTTTYTYDGDLTVPATMSVPCDEASLGAGIDCPSSGLATTTYDYDTDGPVPLLTEQVDPDGVRTSKTYHDDGTLASSTAYDDGDVARTTTYERWYSDREDFPFDSRTAWADRTEEPGGAVSWTTYDAAGRMLDSYTSPEDENESRVGSSTSYNLDGSVASTWSTESGTTAQWTRRWTDADWNELGEAPTIAEIRYTYDADGVATQTKIDHSGDVVATITGDDGLGEAATTTNTYGELGRLLTSTGPTGIVTTYHYDTEGRTTGVTTGPDPDDPTHTVVTEYDARGRVLSETTPMGTDPDGNPVQHKVSYTYDAAGRKVSQLEGSGGPAGEQLLTGYEYDDAGRLWRTVEHRHAYTDTANPLVLHTADKVTETRYTLGGRTAQQVGPPVDVTSFNWSSPDSAKSVTTYGYDDAGRQVTVTAPDGGVSHTAYDENGRVASQTSPGGIETGYRYDSSGRTIEVITPSGLTGLGDPETVSATTRFDGQVTCVTDPHIPDPDPEVIDPSQRCTERTAAGRVAAVTDANGNTVTYGYDSRGNRTSRTALNDSGAEVVESWAYNLADQETGHTVPPPRAGASPKTTTSTYDPDFGWLATVTDPTSRVQTHTYYNDGTRKQTTHTHLADPAVVNKFWVNGRGWRTKSTSKIGSDPTRTWTSTYDRVGQKLTETSDLATLNHSYGLSGEQLTLGYHGGSSTSSYLHDPAGRLTEVSVTSSGVTVPYTSYTYDDDGRQTSELIHAAGGATRAWDYDDAGHLTDFTEVLPNTTSTWETYTAGLTYRPDGRLATETVNSDPTVTYDYDDAGQLTSATDGTGGAPDRSWTYGTRGNRLTSVTDGVTTTYTTNPNGSVAKTTQGTHTVTYVYDDAGRRGSETLKDGTTNVGSTTNGFTTEGYTTTVKVIRPGQATTTDYRSYDTDGLQITTNTIIAGGGSIPRHYQWDKTQPIPQIVEARNSGSTWFRTTWGNQRVAFKSGTAAPQWFQYDARGSVIRTDPTNTDVVTGPQAYDPFGSYGTPTGIDRLGYRGELTASNLTYLRNRNYDPSIGQFTAPDPLDGVDGTTTVASEHHYADNDPLNKIDPLGLRASDAALIAGQVGAACDEVDGRLVYWGDTGTQVCMEPPVGRVEGDSCFPAATPSGHALVYHNGSCGVWNSTIECARGEWFPGANFVCRHSDVIIQGLTIIAVAALGVATGGAAIVYLGGSAGVGFSAGGGALAVASGGTIEGGAAVVLSPAAAGQILGGGSALVAANHISSNSGGDGGGLSREQEKSIRSLEKQVEQHQAKLDAYKADPWAYDNQGFLKNAPSDEVRERIISGRIKHLENEIRVFQDQIRILRGGG